MDQCSESNLEATRLSLHPDIPSLPPDERNGRSTPHKTHPTELLASLEYLRIAQSRIQRLDGDVSQAKSGGFGDVELATLETGQQDGNQYRLEAVDHVAVKKVRYGTDDDDNRVLARFTREIKLLSDLNYKNVVKIIGFVEHFEEGVLWMIFPWEKNGNLREFVRSTNWELPERISLIDDVARGVAYLHGRQPPICHGDLKSLNILINDEHRAVITDFGSAREVNTATQNAEFSGKAKLTSDLQLHEAIQSSLEVELSATGDSIMITGPAWTMHWAAPELLLGTGSVGLASDVWALGWIFWEAITGKFPFHDEDKDVQVVLRITSGKLPKLETDIQFAQVKALCSLMMDCWSFDVDERPSALACQQRLGWMDMKLPPHNAETRSANLSHVLGSIHRHNGAHAEGWNHAETMSESTRTTQNAGNQAAALHDRGTGLHPRNRYSGLERAHTEFCDTFSRLGPELRFAHCVKSLGDVHRNFNQYPEAVEAYTKARDVFLQAGDQLGVAQCVQSLGGVHQMRHEYTEAEKAYTEGRDTFSRIGEQLGFAHCIRSLGDVHQLRKEYPEAEKAYTEARDILSRIGQQLGFAQCVQGLGDVHRMRDEYAQAENAYTEARDIFSRLRSQVGFAQCVQRLGDLYQVLNRHDEAEKAYTEARDIFSRLRHQFNFAQCVQNLGDIHQIRNEYTQAENAYAEARDIFSRIGHQLGFAQCVQRLGDLYRVRNRHNEAEKAYTEARDIFSQLGDQVGLGQCVQSLGEVHQLGKN